MNDHSGTLFSRTWFITKLAPTVGEEKGSTLLDEALAALGLGGSLLLNRDQARKVLDHIASRGGVAGAAARLEAARMASLKPPPSGARSLPPTPASIDLPSLLAPALGLERASAAVAAVCKQLGFDPATLDRARALQALESLGAEGGLVGVTARFTRARMLLSA